MIRAETDATVAVPVCKKASRLKALLRNRRGLLEDARSRWLANAIV